MTAMILYTEKKHRIANLLRRVASGVESSEDQIQLLENITELHKLSNDLLLFASEWSNAIRKYAA